MFFISACCLKLIRYQFRKKEDWTKKRTKNKYYFPGRNEPLKVKKTTEVLKMLKRICRAKLIKQFPCLWAHFHTVPQHCCSSRVSGSIDPDRSGSGLGWRPEKRSERPEGRALSHWAQRRPGRQEHRPWLGGSCCRWRSAPQCWTGSPDWRRRSCGHSCGLLRQKTPSVKHDSN